MWFDSAAILATAVLLLLASFAHAASYTSANVSLVGTLTTTPFRRADGALGFLPGRVLLWGGYTETQVISNDLYNIPAEQNPPPWNQVTGVSGLPANGISFSAQSQFNGSIWTFGGIQFGAKINTVYKIDIATNTYSTPTFTNNYLLNKTADPNHGVFFTMGACSIVTTSGVMYIFGGLTDAAMLNLPSRVSLVNMTFDTITNEDKTYRPSRRYGSACMYSKRGGSEYMVVFGGFQQYSFESHTEVSTTLNDQAIFSINNASWLPGTTPSVGARAFSSVVRLPDGTGSVLYGGLAPDSTYSTMNAKSDFWLFYDSNFSWVPITLRNYLDNPVGRGMAASFVMDNLGELSIFYHGGYSNSQTTLNTFFKLTFNSCPYGDGNCGGTSAPSSQTTTGAIASGTTTSGSQSTGTTAFVPQSVGISSVPFVNSSPSSALELVLSTLF